MQKRLFEISAVVVGVAIVVAIYFYRSDGADQELRPEPAPAAVVTGETIRSPAARSEQPAGETAAPVAVESPAPAAATVDPVEVESARTVWQAAVADLEAVEAELDVLDTRFDAKEAELAEMEAQGMDPDLLEEEMLIFLDGIVDEYDELETRLAEAEEMEAEAAERLARITGAAADLVDPDEY
jgi:hypothetical protein